MNNRGRFRTARAQHQLLRCLSREHPLKTTHVQKHASSIQISRGAEFRTLGPVASITPKKKIPWYTGIPAGAVGCRIQDPGTHGYRWWKTADFSHSACTTHGVTP